MRLSSILPLALSLLPSIVAEPKEVDPNCNTKSCQKSKHLPGAFILVGDSQTAPGSGWGEQFASTMQNNALIKNVVVNRAYPGATSSDSWKEIYDDVHQYSNGYIVFVLIMLGHDESKKPGASVAKFQQRIQKLGADLDWMRVNAIYLTPLPPSTFAGGKVKTDPELDKYVQAISDAADYQALLMADVYKLSIDYFNKIGEANAKRYFAGDTQGLTGAGVTFFANMVPYVFKKNWFLDNLDEWTKARDDIAKAVDQGRFILPG